MDDHLNNLYDADFLIWVDRQVQLLRSRQFEQLDLQHLTDEIADMGAQLKRELHRRLELLLMHLLKYRYQPERISGSWRGTIREQRRRIQLLLKDAPSLATVLDQILAESYHVARNKAADETGLSLDTYPACNPFSREQLLDPDYLPPSDPASASATPGN